jgi:hypothetical protein
MQQTAIMVEDVTGDGIWKKPFLTVDSKNSLRHNPQA